MSLSVFVRQQDAGAGPICFRNDPNLLTDGDAVHAENSQVFTYRQIVLSFIFCATVAPVSTLMAFQICVGILPNLFECIDGSRCSNGLTEWEQGFVQGSSFLSLGNVIISTEIT